MPSNGFVVVGSLATTNALENYGFFIVTIGRDENGHRLSNGFLGGIAEEPLRAVIPTCDHTVEVFGKNGVIGEFNDRGVMLPSAIVRQTIAANPFRWRLSQLPGNLLKLALQLP